MAKKQPPDKSSARPAAKRRGNAPLPAPAPEPIPASPEFPIVALGASAGGLEAFTAVLRNLPADTGMGFVLIQHLDPRHESLLVELLSRTTRMPVEQAAEDTRVRPNHVYIIPPNMDMIIQSGTLRLVSRTSIRGVHMPIDHFLRSLAQDCTSRAIAVVLSGASTDGALGVEAVKGEGGITIAQNDSAKYPSMPRAAVATGFVDLVLPPDKIAQELARIAAHPYVRAAGEPSIPEPAEPEGPTQPHPLSRIFSVLRSTTGVDFTLYKHTTIRRRIARRMAIHKIERVEQYVEFLEHNPQEMKALYQEILIKVTSFFRDPELFQALKEEILPDIFSRLSADSPIRIWVPGCATGEEAYSVGMVLLEYAAENKIISPIQLFATDVNDEAVERARAGIYVENISLDVSPERLRRFFVKHDGGYQVSKTLRDVCIFARQNLAKDPPFSKLDLISCRNVLIYLEPVLQKRIIPMFHYALKPQGYLMLGDSETIGGFPDMFDLADKRHKIYTRRQIVASHRFDFEAGLLEPKGEGAHRLTAVEETPAADIQKEVDRVVLGLYGPPGVVVNENLDVIQFRGKTSPYLEPAPGKASLNLLKMIREGLLLEVRNAVQKVRRTGEPVHQKNVPTKHNHSFRNVDFDVLPLQPGTKGRNFLILFQESVEPPAPPHAKDKRTKAAEGQVEQLKQEVVATRQYLQSIIEEQEATNEELQSANEEILSSNEELQSINEEFETAKEELQSTNEELTTVNEELQTRNSELSQTNDDLNNLLSSVNIAIVMLDNELRVRRFTPMARRILNLIPTDIGRPITDLHPAIRVPDLAPMIGEVLESMTVKERDVPDQDGRWFSLSIRPYRTSDNRVDGAVLVLVDIDAIKRGGDHNAYRDFLAAALDMSAEPLAVLDHEFRFRQANPAFCDLFRLRSEQAEGRSIEQLIGTDHGLRETLERAIRGDGQVRELQLEIDMPSGRHGVAVSARALRPPADREMLLISMKTAQLQSEPRP